jgi:translation initiation factor 2D
MPSTTFYTTYLLPARPAPTPNTSPTPVDIKHSTHKSLTTFLKAAEKAHLLTLKSTKGDVLVAGVSASHPEVLQHTPYFSLRDAEEKKERKEGREEAGRKAVEMRVVEVWKPHLVSIKFFQSSGKEYVLLSVYSLKT